MNKKRVKRAEQKNTLTAFWYSRTSLIVLLVISVFVSISVVKEIVLRIERQQEVAQLENEIARLQDRNTRMSDSITILQSSTKQDKLARSKLGVHAPGEQVVFFPGDQVQPERVFETSQAEIVREEETEDSNPEKWAKYFLGKYSNEQ